MCTWGYLFWDDRDGPTSPSRVLAKNFVNFFTSWVAQKLKAKMAFLNLKKKKPIFFSIKKKFLELLVEEGKRIFG